MTGFNAVKGQMDHTHGLPATCFLMHMGLLYQHTEQCSQSSDLLVVPISRTLALMHLTHAHPLGGHL